MTKKTAVMLTLILIFLAACGVIALRHPGFTTRVISRITERSVPRTIPVISVDTGGAEVLSREEYVSCKVSTINVDPSLTMSGVRAGIRVRGNSSAYYGDAEQIRVHSVPYRLKFEKKNNLLGLNGGAECKSWVLDTSNSGARASVKTDLALRLGRKIVGSDGYYCSDSRLVGLMLNGVFKGVYVLCEQNQVNRHRVNITEPEKGDTDVLTGYFLELDNYREEPCFEMDYGGVSAEDIYGESRTFRTVSYSVKSDIYSDAQLEFVSSYLKNVFRIVYEACERSNYLALDSGYKAGESSFTDPKTCIEAVLDLRSVADMYILYELLCDYDVGAASFFMSVDFAGEYPRLCFTAPWDFEWTWTADPQTGFFAGAFQPKDFGDKYGDKSNPWFILLYKQEWFRDMVKDRWRELGGSEGLIPCVDEEEALVGLFSKDMERLSHGSTEKLRDHFNWVRRRAAWLETVWGQ